MANYKYHHTATARGYVSRRISAEDYPREPYNGRYGKGYKIYSPRWDTTQYCNVTYYIVDPKTDLKKEKKQ